MRNRLALALAILALASCGDDGGSASTAAGSEAGQPSTTVATTAGDDGDFGRWQEATRAVCTEFEPQLDALERQLGQPTTPDQLVPYIDALTPLNDEYTAALLAIPPPTARADEVLRTHELYGALREAAIGTRDAAAAGDLVTVQAQSQALATLGVEVEQLLGGLGLPECQ